MGYILIDVSEKSSPSIFYVGGSSRSIRSVSKYVPNYMKRQPRRHRACYFCYQANDTFSVESVVPLTADVQRFGLLALAHRIVHLTLHEGVVVLPRDVGNYQFRRVVSGHQFVVNVPPIRKIQWVGIGFASETHLGAFRQSSRWSQTADYAQSHLRCVFDLQP